jgi:hypothetical protein
MKVTISANESLSNVAPDKIASILAFSEAKSEVNLSSPAILSDSSCLIAASKDLS